MKYLGKFFLFTLCLQLISCKDSTPVPIEGEQPDLDISTDGNVFISYGLGEDIFCMISKDQGQSFDKPVKVGTIAGMHLGRSRGPQIASSDKYAMITVMDKSGNITAFSSLNSSNQWKYAGRVNDVDGSAPEGLMDLAADDKDHFFAVWLDNRNNKKNKIAFASANDDEWAPGSIVYQSPDSTVCECCQPVVSVSDQKVGILFRNWLNGSRDLYLMQANTKSLLFNSPVKQGIETWKLNGCPMAGGSIYFGENDKVYTAWQRKGEIFFTLSGEAEMKVGKGRLTDLINEHQLVYEDNQILYMKDLDNKNTSEIGKGSFIKSMEIPDKRIFAVWENEGKVQYKLL